MGWIIRVIMKKKFEAEINKIKQENPGISDRKAMQMLVGESLRTYRRLILIVNTIRVVLLIGLLVGAVFIYTTLFNYITTMATIAGNAIVNIFIDEESIEDEDKKPGWEFERPGDGGQDTGGTSLKGPGGIYPIDDKMRYRAELLEMMDVAVADARAAGRKHVEPYWMLGTIGRESAAGMLLKFDNTNISSLYTDLIVNEPACGKGSSCKYTRLGISHYHGGTVVNGKDTGDPYTQAFNTSKTSYDRAGGDHAVGFIQAESPYVYSEVRRIYKNPTPVITAKQSAEVQGQLMWDADLGFARPTVFHIPDAIYNIAFALTEPNRVPIEHKSKYATIIQSADFKSLSDEDQNFIHFVYATCAYTRGHLRASDDDMVKDLIKLGNSGRIDRLDHLMFSTADKHWNDNTNNFIGNKNTFLRHVKNTYGINYDLKNVAWNGVYSASLGKLAHEKLTNAVANSEKKQVGGIIPGGEGSSGGNWVGYPGSGTFGGSDSKYYLAGGGMRWYLQSGRATQHSESSWGTSSNSPIPQDTCR